MLVGIDIGGTKLLIGSCENDGKDNKQELASTPHSLAEGLALIKKLVRAVSAGVKLDAIGVSCGGPLIHQSGVVSPLHCPEWRDVPLAKILKDEFHCPVRIEVDTDAAALAEYQVSKQNVSRLLYITLSTGIGAGFLIDGKIYRGQNGSHPEFGHQSVPSRFQNITCSCGATGCLEAMICGNAIPKNYNKQATQLSIEEWREIGSILGFGIRNAVALYTPDLIVLGGSMALGGGDTLLLAAQSVLDNNCRIVPRCPIKLTTLASTSALKGAKLLAASIL